MELASSCVLAQHCQPAGSHWSIWNCPSILTLRVTKQKNQTAKTTITTPKSIGKKFGWAHEPPWWPVWWRALWKLLSCSAMAAGGSVYHCVGLLMPGTAVGSEAGLLLLRSPAGHFLGSYLNCPLVLMLNSAPWRSTPMLLWPQRLPGCACCYHHAYVLPLPGSAESPWGDPRRGRVAGACSRETDPVVLTMLSLLGYGCPLEWAEFGIKLGCPIPLSQNTLQ